MSISQPMLRLRSAHVKPVVRDWRAEYLDRLNQARRAAEIITECYPGRALDQVKRERFNHERRDA